MARLPRSLTVQPRSVVHKIWRGHNRESNIGKHADKSKYMELLNDDLDCKAYPPGGVLNAITLMSNHTHEIYYIYDQPYFSNHMRRHHSRYGAYFNRINRRSGKVAEERPKTCLIGDDYHAMIATLYVHANPVRAKMSDSQRYQWSTHCLYAYGKREPWMKNIVLPKWYMALGKNMEDRQRRYRRLYASYLKREGINQPRFFTELFYGTTVWVDVMKERTREWRRDHSPP